MQQTQGKAVIQTKGKDIQLEDAIKMYGHPKLLTREEAVEAFESGNKGLASLIMDDQMYDNFRSYDDEEYRIENEIPKWSGEEPPSEDFQWMNPGFGIFNVLDRYLFPHPIPDDVRIIGIDFGLLEGVENGTD